MVFALKDKKGITIIYGLLSKNTLIDLYEMHINKLDDIVNEFNNTHHRTIKMKPVDVESITYLNFNTQNNKNDPKF